GNRESRGVRPPLWFGSDVYLCRAPLTTEKTACSPVFYAQDDYSMSTNPKPAHLHLRPCTALPPRGICFCDFTWLVLVRAQRQRLDMQRQYCATITPTLFKIPSRADDGV